ncbi:hypothetical protein [Pontivivens insulae]|uniref:Component of SufBCD complex n=1 Tax=Pontivivens insulae TaxID=1639689 RepID=A0A2R8AAU5_9RHOB|nr:hypothetical protein [Pontivivens insulae]RED13265.1 hypothetical protein DFR53_2401 [Pontivivens insulae]SPF29357.1 hypothetical protein POI8812_01665 [Pontivivens insulae]
MMSVIDRLISFESFGSVWYWIFLGLAWSSRTHWTIGIPFDAIMRADRRGGEWEADIDRLAIAASRRFALIAGKVAAVLTLFVTFFLAALATAALYLGNELSQAMLAIALPMIVAEVGDIRLAQRIHHQQIRGYELRRAIVWRRFLNQATGLSSLILATLFATFQFLDRVGYFDFW